MKINNNQVEIEKKKKRDESFELKKNIGSLTARLKNKKAKVCEIKNVKEENIDLKDKLEIYSNGVELACDELNQLHKSHNECNKKHVSYDKNIRSC